MSSRERFALSLAAVLATSIALSRQGAAEEAARKLTLEECARLALAANLSLRLRWVDERELRLRVREERSAFFPVLSADLSFQGRAYASPYTYIDPSGRYDQRELSWGLGATELLPISTQLSLKLSSGVTWTEMAAAQFSPQNYTSLELTVTQPLLRGIGRTATVSRLEAARIDQRASLQRIEAEASQLLLETARAYWDLANRVADLGIARESVELARRQRDTTGKRLQSGLISQHDLTEADAAVATRQQELSEAEQAVLRAEKTLLLLIHEHPRQGEQTRGLGLPLRPAASPEVLPEGSSLGELVARALKQRPELRALALEGRSNALSLDAAKNAALPRLDLTGTVGLSSLAGVIRPSGQPSSTPDWLVGGYGAAWEQVLTGKLPYGLVALKLELPTSADARRVQAEKLALAGRRIAVQEDGIRARIAVEVRDAHHRLRGSRSRIEAAREGVRLLRRNLEAIEKKFGAGLCGSYDVLRVQLELSRANRVLAQATTEQAIARAELAAATGELPDYLGIVIK